MRSVLIAILFSAALASAQTTQGGPVDSARVEQLRRSFSNLADRDPVVREVARRDLLGMNRAELEEFRQIINKSRPLLPNQAAVLREIVTHVYLSGETYQQEPRGFLGVHLPIEIGAFAVDGEGTRGITVVGRVKGFCGYRMLEDMDVILSGTTMAGQHFDGVQLSSVIASQLPGNKVILDVLRQGKIIQVTITLDAHPPDNEVEKLQATRKNRADEYWEKEFAGIVREQTS